MQLVCWRHSEEVGKRTRRDSRPPEALLCVLRLWFLRSLSVRHRDLLPFCTQSEATVTCGLRGRLSLCVCMFPRRDPPPPPTCTAEARRERRKRRGGGGFFCNAADNQSIRRSLDGRVGDSLPAATSEGGRRSRLTPWAFGAECESHSFSRRGRRSRLAPLTQSLRPNFHRFPSACDVRSS